MNRKDFYYRQPVTADELDGAFDDVDNGIRDVVQGLGLVGIVAGGGVAESSPQGMSVVVEGPTVAFDSDGQHIYVATDQEVDLSVDEDGASTTIGTPSNERWLSIFLAFDRSLSDTRIDGNGTPVFFVRGESYQIHVVQGAEAGSGLATRPSLRADEVLLADVLITQGDGTVANADINTDRRQRAFVTSGGSVNSRTLPEALQALETAITGGVAGAVSLGLPDTIIATKTFGPNGVIAAASGKPVTEALITDERSGSSPILLAQLADLYFYRRGAYYELLINCFYDGTDFEATATGTAMRFRFGAQTATDISQVVQATGAGFQLWTKAVAASDTWADAAWGSTFRLGDTRYFDTGGDEPDLTPMHLPRAMVNAGSSGGSASATGTGLTNGGTPAALSSDDIVLTFSEDAGGSVQHFDVTNYLVSGGFATWAVVSYTGTTVTLRAYDAAGTQITLSSVSRRCFVKRYILG